MEYPAHVNIIEVGPRDGFQNIKEFIPTDLKVRIICDLIASGVSEIELTSFTSPKAIPQMADSAEVVKRVYEQTGKYFKGIALVPNLRGAQNAAESGLKNITFVVSVSEHHNQANVRRTVDESLDELKAIITSMPELSVRLDVATAFGCPYEGKIPEESVLKLIRRALDLGVKELCLCDTIGVANPVQTASLLRCVQSESGNIPITMHMHDTRGMGLVNLFVGLENGITRFETAVGGLGGCPFAPGAAGNTATEDAVNMLHEMNISTGINIELYMKVVKNVQDLIKPDLTGRMIRVKEYC